MTKIITRDEASKPLNNVVPLTKEDIDHYSDYKSNDQNWEPIIPAPCEPVKPSNAVGMWIYRDIAGNPVTARIRFEKDGKKDVLPFTYGRKRPDQESEWVEGWHYKAPKDKATLYNLDHITRRIEAPVLIVEGEKTADSATKIYPDYVVTTSQSGSKAVNKTDWTSLRNRHVVLWGDHDEAGRDYVQTVIHALGELGCASISVVLLDDVRIPNKWDLGDPLPSLFGIKEADKQSFYNEWIVRKQEVLTATVKFPHGVKQKEEMLYLSYQTKDGDFKEKLLSDRLFVKGRVANRYDAGHGLILGFKSHAGRFKDVVIPLTLLADAKLLKRELLDKGFVVYDGEGLANFLNEVKVNKLYQTIDQTGWNVSHDNEWGFILPTKERWGCKEFFTKENIENPLFSRRGFVHDWQREIGQYIRLNSRLCFACCVGLAGLLLEPLGKKGTGFHFVGSSSIGKTTIANVASSIFGKPREQIKSWKTTANGLEQISSYLSHTVLILDEMSEVGADVAFDLSYMLANGIGKQRATPTGEARTVMKWLLNFISTGEITLKAKLAEIKRKTNAGQEARLINIPADAGYDLGVLDVVPDGFEDAEAFIHHLNKSSSLYYGEIGRAFIRFLVKKINGTDEIYLNHLNDRIRLLVKEWIPIDADTQIKRVCEKFVLSAVAGEEATEQGFTGWNAEDALRACKICFDAWLEHRGGVENEEVIQAVENVKEFIAKNAESRFSMLLGTNALEEDPSSKTANRVGHRKQDPITKDWEYWVYPQCWAELCGGLDGAFVARVLADKGFLDRGSEKKSFQQRVRFNNVRRRMYVLTEKILE